MHPFTTAVWLAVAGAAGTLLRAGLTTLAVRLLGPGFPWGTLAVNLLGSFAFGLIFASARARGGVSTEAETILLVGLLGGFTTYSSFAFQATEMLQHGRPLAAAAYVLATNLAGIAAIWAGLRAGAT
jgi:CrcB protein